MTTALSLLCRVIRRRLTSGESLDDIIKDYPKLTPEEKNIILAELSLIK